MTDERGEGPSDESVIVAGLVTRAAEGEREAQQELLRRYWHVLRVAVRARLYTLGHLRPEIEDLQQDVALHLLAQLGKHEWRGERAFAAWVRRIADARVVDAHRNRHAIKRHATRELNGDEVSELAAPSGSSQESRIDRQRRMAQAAQVMRRLSPDQEAAMMMHAMGFSHREIGDVLEISEEAARKLVSRTIERLQKKVRR